MGAELLLLPLTPLYSAAVRLRAAAYRHGVARVESLAAPVVSVGNLTFGGTGKTPVVTALARDLARRGRRPAVLTRGYGRQDRAPVVLVGPEPGVGPDTAGDEPLEMACRLPGVPVVVDADRLRGGREALRRRADVLLLDDGFQYLGLARDLDLVLVDAGDPWGGGHLPPLGRLREPRRALRRADAVLVTKLRGDDGRLAALRREIERLAPGVPVFGSRLAARRWIGPEGPREPAALAGRRVFAFAGIGRPAGFTAVLEALGVEVVGRRWFADHHGYTAEDVAAVTEEAARLDAVPVTTGKDAVKLPQGHGAWVLEVDVEPLAGSWDELWRLAPGVAG